MGAPGEPPSIFVRNRFFLAFASPHEALSGMDTTGSVAGHHPIERALEVHVPYGFLHFRRGAPHQAADEVEGNHTDIPQGENPPSTGGRVSPGIPRSSRPGRGSQPSEPLSISVRRQGAGMLRRKGAGTACKEKGREEWLFRSVLVWTADRGSSAISSNAALASVFAELPRVARPGIVPSCDHRLVFHPSVP